MPRHKEPSKILVVSGQKQGEKLLSTIDRWLYSPTLAHNAQDVRRMLIDNEYETVIINSPLPCGQGYELAMDIAENTHCGVLVIAPAEDYDRIRHRLSELGIITLCKPAQPEMLELALSSLSALFIRTRMMEQENNKLRIKLEEMRTVNRAKRLLMTREGMSEEQAHKYIEKRAMDERKTRMDIAKAILK